MTQIKRGALHPEWVLMYRNGISAPKIAPNVGVAPSVVLFHLAIAAKQDRGLRAEHRLSLPPAAPRLTAAGQRNLDDILAFYQEVGRLPVASRHHARLAWAAHQAGG